MSSKEKDGNWFKRHKILTVILAVIAIGIIATAANGGSTSNSSGGGTSNTPTDTKTEEAKPQKLSLQETFDKIESGMANTGGAKRTYGKWLVRMRMDKSSGVKYAVLMWPSSGNWPADGEIDFAEDGGGNRTGTAATTHWGTLANRQQAQRSLVIDMSQWQTVGLEWTPGSLKYTANGQVWGTVTSPAEAIPKGPMFLAIQTEANTLGANQWMTNVDANSPRPTKLEVDWVVTYAQAN